MVRTVRFVLAGCALTALSVRAQLAPASTLPETAATSSGQRSGARAKAPAPRVISSDVAAQLAASRPKFSPVAPPPPPKPESELPDMREVDKPKNTIVRLPKFVVQEQRPPVFRERDIYTKKGLESLAMRRYFTETDRVLNRFRLPLFSVVSNEERAMAMYEEDERLKNMSDIADNTNMVMKSNAAAGTKMKADAQQTFMRWQDFGWNGGSKK